MGTVAEGPVVVVAGTVIVALPRNIRDSVVEIDRTFGTRLRLASAGGQRSRVAPFGINRRSDGSGINR